MKIQAWGYDVWGNEEDGFEVNNRYKLGLHTITERQWENYKSLAKAAKKIFGLLPRIQLKDIEVEGDEHSVYFTHKPDGYPIGEFIIEG